MRYWPLSVITRDPRLHHVHTWELMCAYHGAELTFETLAACNQVAATTPSCHSPLAIVHSVDAPMRRVYLDYPAPEDWLRLERGGFFTTGDDFGFVVDALH